MSGQDYYHTQEKFQGRNFLNFNGLKMLHVKFGDSIICSEYFAVLFFVCGKTYENFSLKIYHRVLFLEGYKFCE